MGNKQSYENGKKLLSINETEYGVLLHVVDMNHNHNEHLKFVETKYSKLGTFSRTQICRNSSTSKGKRSMCVTQIRCVIYYTIKKFVS